MRFLRRAFLPLSLVTLVAAAFVVPLPVYLETPGRLLSLVDCVDVESERAAPVDGDYLLTTVNLEGGTFAGTLRGVLDDDVAVVRRRDVVPPQVDADRFFRRQEQLFASSAEVAAAVGLRAAGFDADVSGDGVLVVRTVGGTAADGVLAAGDVITAVDGEPTPTDAALREAIVGAGSGEPLAVTFRRGGAHREVELTPTPLAGRPVLGVEVQTLNPKVDLPVAVEVESGSIGGPSAGLMIAVTVYDKVTPAEDVAAGRRIAGTGTLDAEGNVGPIGGVRQKAIAAARDGAEVFLAPAEQLAAARGGVAGDVTMQLVGVEDFDGAVRSLLQSAPPVSQETAEATEPSACPFREAA